MCSVYDPPTEGAVDSSGATSGKQFQTWTLWVPGGEAKAAMTTNIFGVTRLGSNLRIHRHRETNTAELLFRRKHYTLFETQIRLNCKADWPWTHALRSHGHIAAFQFLVNNYKLLSSINYQSRNGESSGWRSWYKDEQTQHLLSKHILQQSLLICACHFKPAARVTVGKIGLKLTIESAHLPHIKLLRTLAVNFAQVIPLQR